MLANYIFSEIDDKNKKVKLYFQDDAGDIHEITMANEDYINNKLAVWGISKVDQINDYFTEKPEVEIFQYSRVAEDGTTISGDTLDKPFPRPTDPKTKAVVSGKVIDIQDNGLKVAVTLEDKEDGKPFTVVRAWYIFNKATKTSYPVKAKKDKLLRDYGVKSFDELKGREVTFIRQKAGVNFYYDMG